MENLEKICYWWYLCGVKRVYYIFVTITLSLLMVYLGVGVAFIQYNCSHCAMHDEASPILSVASVSDAGSCENCCDMMSHEKCHCQQTQKHTEGGCTHVKIEKINMPTLADGMNMSIPAPSVFVIPQMLLHIDVADLFVDSHEEPSIDISPYIKIPRAYLNSICTLLI